MLVNYPWPGNVRELKNIAEQVSVLSQDRTVSAKEFSRFIPESRPTSMLPVLASAHNGHPHAEFNSERDIMYKLFFDMKKDVTELKKMFLEILHNPSSAPAAAAYAREHLMKEMPAIKEIESPVLPQPQPMVYHGDDIHEHIEVEESLNIMDKEKELIEKALKKHKGKRKDAASDLGISERTLYRKLKEYNIEE
jgi:DNA-binding NtrC family response regulator